MSRTEQFGAVSRGQTFVYEPEKLVLVTDKAHPLYDPTVLDAPPKELVENIKELGVIVPILVRKNGLKRGKPIIEVIEGRNRVKAAIIANKELKAQGFPPRLIPAVYRACDEDEAMTCMVVTNEQRKVENHVDRALKLKMYLDRGFTEKQARVAFGLSSSKLATLKSVLEMTKEIQAALRSKSITMTIAVEISKLPRSKQVTVLQDVLAVAGKGRGRAATECAEKKVNGEVKTRLRSRKAVEKARDALTCVPSSEYQRGAMEALAWVAGEMETPWGQ